MREIKFRAANTDNKGRFISWVYGTPEFGDMGQLYMHYAVGAIMLCQRDTLGQFTGLKDKNGCDIYEGDIMSDPLPNGAPWTSEVRWSQPEACYFPQGLDRYEVIGNIYENPDLLSAPKEAKIDLGKKK